MCVYLVVSCFFTPRFRIFVCTMYIVVKVCKYMLYVCECRWWCFVNIVIAFFFLLLFLLLLLLHHHHILRWFFDWKSVAFTLFKCVKFLVLWVVQWEGFLIMAGRQCFHSSFSSFVEIYFVKFEHNYIYFFRCLDFKMFSCSRFSIYII